MKFGFGVPTRGPLATPADITEIARTGEALGFATAYVNDHIVVPRTIGSRYPYSETGDWAGGRFGEAMELLPLLGFLASATSSLRLLTSVMVIPYRQPVVTAKMIATIDVLSGGRVTIGCGAGWMEEEFVAVGAPPFAERGKVVDEYLTVFREIWTSEAPRHDGAYVRFGDIASLPHPVQKPHPPLWIGGESGPALRRAARLGDGWYPIGNNPRFPLDTLPRYEAGVLRLKAAAEQVGRDPASLTLAYNPPWFRGPCDPVTVEGERRLFTGGADDIRSDIAALETLGVEHLMLTFEGRDRATTLQHLESFADQFIPERKSS